MNFVATKTVPLAWWSSRTPCTEWSDCRRRHPRGYLPYRPVDGWVQREAFGKARLKLLSSSTLQELWTSDFIAFLGPPCKENHEILLNSFAASSLAPSHSQVQPKGVAGPLATSPFCLVNCSQTLTLPAFWGNGNTLLWFKTEGTFLRPSYRSLCSLNAFLFSLSRAVLTHGTYIKDHQSCKA